MGQRCENFLFAAFKIFLLFNQKIRGFPLTISVTCVQYYGGAGAFVRRGIPHLLNTTGRTLRKFFRAMQLQPVVQPASTALFDQL